MFRFPRLKWSITVSTSDPSPASGSVTSPRIGSEIRGCSTLITSAPQSARMAAPAGTNPKVVSSTILTPSIARISSIAGAIAILPCPLSRESRAG